MTDLLKSFPTRCWFTSLGVLLATLAVAHFFPSDILTESAKLTSLIFLFYTVFFVSYLGLKATGNPMGLTAVITIFIGIAYWQASWYIVGLGFFFLAICIGIRYLSNQVKDTGRELSLSEKKYWYWVNEFADGRSSILSKKPKK